MERATRNEINLERKREFKKNCKEANATPFNCRWNWENIGNNVGQLTIYDYNGEPVALWEETRERLQLLIDEWGFRENQYLAIGITRLYKIIGVGLGVFSIAWMGLDGLFQSIYFDQRDTPADEGLDAFGELDELSESDDPESMDSTLEDEFRELDEIFED